MTEEADDGVGNIPVMFLDVKHGIGCIGEISACEIEGK